MKKALHILTIMLILLTFVLPLRAQIDLDTVKSQKFDTGKMWSFDYPPVDFFKQTYGFTPDESWFEDVRLSALRLPNCTSSFVSEDGLMMTNHHCARRFSKEWFLCKDTR